jgi:hypothetical protein
MCVRDREIERGGAERETDRQRTRESEGAVQQLEGPGFACGGFATVCGGGGDGGGGGGGGGGQS